MKIQRGSDDSARQTDLETGKPLDTGHCDYTVMMTHARTRHYLTIELYKLMALTYLKTSKEQFANDVDRTPLMSRQLQPVSGQHH